MPVVFELPKGTFGLYRTINAKQLAIFCCDPFQRILPEIGKFAACDQFLLLFRIFRFTALSTIRTTVTILTTIPCYYSDRSVLAVFSACTNIRQDAFVLADIIITGTIVCHIFSPADLSPEFSGTAAFIIHLMVLQYSRKRKEVLLMIRKIHSH